MLLAFTPRPIIRSPRPAQPGRAGGAGVRQPAGDRPSRWNPAAIGQGFGPPGIRPPTPPQPGSPAPLPLGPWILLGLGVSVLAKLLWDALNPRPPATPRGLESGDEWTVSPTNTPITVAYTIRRIKTFTARCGVPGWPLPATTNTTQNYASTYSGVSAGVISGGNTSATVCGGSGNTLNPNHLAVYIETAAGGRVEYGGYSTIAEVRGSYWESETVETLESLQITGGGYDQTHTGVNTPGQFAPGTEPAVPFPLPSTAPEPFRLPAPNPVPTILPATLPGTSPAPAPAQAPGGLPAAEPATAPAPATVPTLVRTVTTSTPGSQPQTLTATGVTTAPAPAPIMQTPAEAVMIGGQLVGGPGATPPPGPAGTAAELGRIEKKMELALDKISPLGELVDALGLLGALLSLLEEEHPGSAYSIRPACGTDASGNPLPVIDVPIAGGLGVVGAIVPRLDAIAELLDLHKQLRQPVCKGKPTGDPVTVTGVEQD